ncbi:hypothetical protein DP199_21950 [Enterobacter kobei]|nr:hypothetical protein DP199_21950 [Enterobacter kobei]
MMAIAASIIALSANSYAADDHKGHDHDKKAGAHQDDTKPMYGGVVSVVKDMNYELVAKPASLELYITDHGKPVDVKNATATVTLLSAAGKEEAKLTPMGGNKLGVAGNFKTGAGTKALAMVTVPSQPVVNVRFSLK